MTSMDFNAILLYAAKCDDWATAKKAINHGANPLATDENGDSASILFACHGNCRAVLGLAKIAKSTLEQADKQGNTPGICFALHNAGDAAVRVAAEYPHIVRQKNTRGATMATWFAGYQNLKTVLALATISPAVFTQEDKDGPITAERFKNHADYDSYRRLKELEFRRRSNW